MGSNNWNLNYLKENTSGIDTPIRKLQIYLYDNLVNLWGFNLFDSYGRVYKNKRDNKTIPEYYSGKKEYKEVLLDDNLDGIMFFSLSDFTNVISYTSIKDCDIIFSINLKRLGFSEERQDEEVRQQVLTLLNNYTTNHKVKSEVTGLGNVYKDYNGVQDYFYDMQDFHHFKITLEIRYNNLKCK